MSRRPSEPPRKKLGSVYAARGGVSIAVSAPADMRAPPLAAALARALAAWCSAASPAPSGGAVASSGSSAGAAGTLWPWSTWHERHALSAHLERRERSGEG